MFTQSRTQILSFFALLFVLLTGCSSHQGGQLESSGVAGPDHVSTTIPDESPTGRIEVRQALLRSVPVDVTQQRFTGLSSVDTVLYGPVSRDKAATVVLEDVPVGVTRLQIEYLVSGQVVGLGSVAVQVTENQTTVVVDPPFLDLTEALESLTIDPANSSIAAGTSQHFTAQAQFTDGTTANLSSSVSWASSSGSVATISSTGEASSTTPGQTIITADYGGVQASATLIVTDAVVVSVSVRSANPAIAEGTSEEFTAVAHYSDGTEQDVSTRATWSSTDTAVAEIGSTGVATAEGEGVTTIRAVFMEISAERSLTVTAAVIKSLQIVPESSSIPNGTGKQYKATATLSNGDTQNVTSAAVWSVAGTSATVQSDPDPTPGLATAVATGDSTITATYKGKSADALLSVSDAEAVSISVTSDNLAIANGTDEQFQAVATFSDHSTVDVSMWAEWSSSSEGIAQIDSSGLASALTKGQTTIQATYGGKNGQRELAVVDATVKSVVVTPDTQSVALGGSVAYSAFAALTDGTTQNVTSGADWTVTGPTATIESSSDPNPGLASAIAVGSSTITASYAGQSDDATINVTSATLLSVELQSSRGSVTVGTKEQFTAIGVYSDGSLVDVTDLADWSSTVPSFASVETTSDTQPGLVSGLSAGTSTIVAHYGSVMGTQSFQVTDLAIDTLTVDSVNLGIAGGTTEQFSAVATFADGSTQDVTDFADWSSTDITAATVLSQRDSRPGLVTGLAAGTTTIQAGFGTAVGSRDLSVKTVTVSSVVVSATNLTIARNTTETFKAVAELSDGGAQDVSDLAVWTSGTPSVATMSGSTALGLAAGDTTVSAEFGSVVGSTTLTVFDSTLANLQIDPPNALVSPGGSSKFRAIATYEDGSTQDVTAFSLWRISGNEAAFVEGGRVSVALHAVRGIPAQIQASFSGNLSAPATLNINLFLYALNNSDRSITGLVCDLQGLLSTLSATNTRTGTAPNYGATDPRGRYLYVTHFTENSVWAFDIGTDGKLAKISETSIGAGQGGSGLVLDPDGRYLYAAAGGNDKIRFYKINSNGSLTQHPASPVGSGDFPVTPAISPNGRFLYAPHLQGAQVAGYRVNTDGSLTALSGFPIKTGDTPQSFSFHPSGHFAYVCTSANDQVRGYRVGDDGSLTQLAGSPYSAGDYPINLDVSPDGRNLYVANRDSDDISAFSLGTDGSLTELPTSPYATTGTFPFSVKVDPTGRFLFASSLNANGAESFLIESGGSLSPSGGGVTPTGNGCRYVVTTP